MALKCFVVTPFGDKNSTEQWEKDLAIHIERVYERILRPAQAICAERGVEIAIADGRSLPRSGQILEKIASEIDQADVILVILVNDRKPNVFIEFLITHLRQPEILLERNSNILNCKEIVSGA